MLKNSLKGAAIAAAVVSLASVANLLPTHAAAAASDAVRADNSCSGKNGCKGQDPNTKKPKIGAIG